MQKGTAYKALCLFALYSASLNGTERRYIRLFQLRRQRNGMRCSYWSISMPTPHQLRGIRSSCSVRFQKGLFSLKITSVISVRLATRPADTRADPSTPLFVPSTPVGAAATVSHWRKPTPALPLAPALLCLFALLQIRFHPSVGSGKR